MDRNIVYPGSIPLDTDILGLNRNAMVGVAALTAAVLGSNVVVDGLGCTPSVPASLTVNVGPGSITQLSALDSTPYGSLSADLSDQIVKTGVNLHATSFTLAAPTSSGQSVNFLIEAAFSETDASPVVLPYVNAANPALPYSGRRWRARKRRRLSIRVGLDFTLLPLIMGRPQLAAPIL
jgi:hypothetical protein